MTSPLKWVGGKHRSAEVVVKALPSVDVLIEPMCGACHISIEMARRKKAKMAYLSDGCERLIEFWSMFLIKPKIFVTTTKKDGVAYSRRIVDYLKIEDEQARFTLARNTLNNPEAAIEERAVAFYVVNRFGFNGLFRVNKKGLVNTPVGRGNSLPKAEPLLESYLLLNELLGNLSRNRISDRTARLAHGPYIDRVFAILPRALEQGSVLVYMDPPYPGTYNQYTADRWNPLEYRALATLMNMIRDSGAKVALSYPTGTHLVELMKRLGMGWTNQGIDTITSCSAKVSGRSKIKGALVLST